MSIEKVTTEEVRTLLKFIHKGYKVPKIIHDVLFDTAVREIENKDKVVIIKRDPDVGKNRIQAVFVKIIEGETREMDIHPASVGGFGADFDGDTMAIFVPISNDAQMEAKRKMVSVTNNSSINAPNFNLTNEMITGLYTITMEKPSRKIPVKIRNVQEAKKLDVYAPIECTLRGKKITTTAGKYIFNTCLPDWYPFFDGLATKKEIGKILSSIIDKSKSDYANSVDNLMKVGFYYATIIPQTFSLDMLKISPELVELKKKFAVEKDISKQMELLNKMDAALLEVLKKDAPDLYIMVHSGAAKGIGQLRQMMVAKGLISDAVGNILPPIAKAMNDGYSPEEYFEAGAGARKAMIDRSMNTAHGGYAYRKMIYVLGNVEADLNMGNCNTRRTLDIKLTNELFGRLRGRYTQDSKGNLKPVSKEDIGKIIHLRSPVFCKSRGICRTCFGELIHQMASENIGIIAAQEVASLSEKIMKCSCGLVHVGDKLVPFEDLFDSIKVDREVINDYGTRVERKKSDVIINGKNGSVRTYTIERHKPKDDIIIITTRSGNFIACQGNHPLFIKETALHHLRENEDCRLVGNNEYIAYDSARIEERARKFSPTDENVEVIRADAVRENDAIWIDNTICTDNTQERKIHTSPYICALYCTRGTWVSKFDVRWEGFFIECSGELRNNVIENNVEKRKYKLHENGVTFRTKSDVMKNLVKGDGPTRRLIPDFLDFKKEWLAGFMGGIIDSWGELDETYESTFVNIYTESYYFAQQIKSICLKLGYNMIFKPIGGNMHKDPVRFVCRISFKDKEFLPICKTINLDSVKTFSKGSLNRGIKGFDTVSKIYRVRFWNDDVYDIKTETEEFLLGMVQNHNSFHVGGAVSVASINYKEVLMQNIEDSLESKLISLILQNHNELITKANLTRVSIQKSIYKGDYKIQRMEDRLRLPNGYFELEIDDLKIPATIEQEVDVLLEDGTLEENEDYISVIYPTNSIVLSSPPVSEDNVLLAQKLDSMAGGKSPWTTPESLYMKFYTTLKGTGGWDSCHLEVIISNILRWRKDPQQPARLKEPYDPITLSVKTLPFVISWPLGLAFENFGKGLQYGLISDRGPSSKIEKVMFGESLIKTNK